MPLTLAHSHQHFDCCCSQPLGETGNPWFVKVIDNVSRVKPAKRGMLYAELNDMEISPSFASL